VVEPDLDGDPDELDRTDFHGDEVVERQCTHGGPTPDRVGGSIPVGVEAILACPLYDL
jgi:hypothetical protein